MHKTIGVQLAQYLVETSQLATKPPEGSIWRITSRRNSPKDLVEQTSNIPRLAPKKNDRLLGWSAFD